jgi:hypothetical protein
MRTRASNFVYRGPSPDTVDAWAEGLRASAPAVHRAASDMHTGWLRWQAEQSTRHAAWYGSLPWWRRWWVMVTRR